MKSALSTMEIEFLFSLVEGDPVEIFDERGNVLWRGWVETPAPELGVAWLRTEIGERRLLDFHEHFVRRLPLR